MREALMWASDVPISSPEPLTHEVVWTDFGGVCFTGGGLAHNMTEADREEMFLPTFAPEGLRPSIEEPLSDRDLDFGGDLPNPSDEFYG